jgi:biopolymer transport protein ExbD
MAQVPGSEEVDLNLVPLLDLVLQMVMFFIMVANFAQQQTVAEVMLPAAVSARPPDPGVVDVMYLNLNRRGEVIVPGQEPLNTLTQIRYYLKTEYDTVKKATEAKGEKAVNTVVIIRADKDAEFKPIFEVLREAKTAGFRKWQLRATVKGGPSE